MKTPLSLLRKGEKNLTRKGAKPSETLHTGCKPYKYFIHDDGCFAICSLMRSKGLSYTSRLEVLIPLPCMINRQPAGFARSPGAISLSARWLAHHQRTFLRSLPLVLKSHHRDQICGLKKKCVKNSKDCLELLPVTRGRKKK